MRICIFRVSLLSVVALTLVGCSWVTTFAVANKSAAPIVVEYRISSAGNKTPPCPDGQAVEEPRVVAITDIGNINGSKTVIEYSCSPEQRLVTLTLAPSYAVSIFKSFMYSGESIREEDVIALSVSGERGTVSYTGNQLASNFKKHSDSLYILSYQ